MGVAGRVVSEDAIFMNKLNAVVWGVKFFTWAEKLKVLDVVGVNEMTPLEGLRNKPLGKALDVFDQVYGAEPPEFMYFEEFENNSNTRLLQARSEIW